MGTPLTIDHVAAIMPNAMSNGLGREWSQLLSTLRRFNISNKERIAAFLMNVAKESGELFYVEEIADGWAYEWRSDLGNIYAGDGPFYKGHGYIQITGRNNHSLIAQALGIDCINNPKLLCETKWAWLTAGYYWKNMSSWGDLNVLADNGDYRGTIKGVRGGPDADREHYYWRALEVLPDDVQLPEGGTGMVTGDQIAEAAEELLGVWYVWWKEGDPIPMWWYRHGPSSPPRDYFDANGIMCSDLVNRARMECGLSAIGGTPAIYDWLLNNDCGENFDSSTPGVRGAVVVNPGPWRGDNVLPQGHTALYVDEHRLIQATDGVGDFAGVNNVEMDWDAGWANYWLYGLMPDVDYSASGIEVPEMVVPPEEIENVADEKLMNWYGIGSDNVVRLGGPDTDWSNGWLGTALDGSLVRVA